MTALIFDVETHKLHGDIIEAAWLDVNLLKNQDQHDCLITNLDHFSSQRYKPSEPISIAAMAIHHIIDEDLENCPSFKDFSFPIGAKVKYLIGHNIKYDIAAVKRTGASIKNIKTICTLAMSRYLWPKLETHNLVAMIYYTHSHIYARSETKNAHQARIDVLLTYNLLRKIIIEANKLGHNIFDLEALFEFSEFCVKNPTHIFSGQYKGQAIKDIEEQELNLLFESTKDQYLKNTIKNEILQRNILNDQEQLPFI